MKEIKIQITDEKYEQISELVNIENFLNIKLPPKQDKKRTEEDFVKGLVNFYLRDLSGVESLVKLAGLNDTENHPRYHNHFKEIAKAQNISQRDIIRMTGIQQSSLSQIFNNKWESNPRLDTFFKIWVALECPPITQCLYRVDG